MAVPVVLVVSLWISSVLTPGLSCPELCTCSEKHNRYSAECSYKGLTEMPDDLPSNVTTVSLSANKISLVPSGSFDNVTGVLSLWMANNQIVIIEPGALSPLAHLRNFDVSHNKLVDFPWEDLQNLMSLQLLKMNHNEMTHLPKDAFSNLKSLTSIRLNNNRFTTIAEGTFEGLVSLTHLQIFTNPFACTCSLDWLRGWISTTTNTFISDKENIKCYFPEKLKGEAIGQLPESMCSGPEVMIRTEPDIHNSTLTEGTQLVLVCDFTGNPKPLVMWSIESRSQKQQVALSFTEDESEKPNEDSLLSNNPVKVFNNGTLIIPRLRKKDSGNYSCSATNEFGRSEESVAVDVVGLPKLRPTKKPTTTPRDELTTTTSYRTTPPSVHQTTRISVFDSLPDLKTNDFQTVEPTLAPTAEIKSSQEEVGRLSQASKCGLTANTRYVSSHVSNGSFEDVKQYTFDFGVIALGVSETEATVRLNPLLIPRERSPDGGDTSSEEEEGVPDFSESRRLNGLYLCVTADRKHSAVQWSRIKDGVTTYVFSDLRPGTNYSLCLTYRGEDCEVQVLFATRRRVPNLLIIISVSICLLTVSTVPLLGATCFHLVYKYRSKTYKLIMKAKDQYHVERNLTVNFNLHAPHADSQRKMNESQLDEEEGETETESGDGLKEPDTEESIMTESFSLSHCRGNLDSCEVGSEYSDRLPLGAEAVNITND